MYRLAMTAVLMALCLMPSPALASKRGWAQASDAGRDVMVLAALGVPAVQGDWRGDLEAAGSLRRQAARPSR